MESMVIFKRNKDLMQLNDTEINDLIKSTSLIKIRLVGNMTFIQKMKFKKELDDMDNLLLDLTVEKYLRENKYDYKDMDKMKTMEYCPIPKERMDIFVNLIKELK